MSVPGTSAEGLVVVVGAGSCEELEGKGLEGGAGAGAEVVVIGALRSRYPLAPRA